MRPLLLPLVALALLASCTSWRDSTRASIRSWCENTPEWCDVTAVK